MRFDGIYCRWCLGYLEDEDLIVFLGRCKLALNNSKARYTRKNPPGAFIFVLDNVKDSGVKLQKKKGQLVRDQQSLERIFHEADLCIYERSDLTMLNAEYYPVMVWALY